MRHVRTSYSIARIVVIGLSTFLIFSSIFLALTAWMDSNTVRSRLDSLISSQQSLVDTERSVITNKISRLSADLLYIRATLDIDGYPSGSYDAISADWAAFSNAQKVYDQIRFIDIDGNEIIRVNYSADGAVSVPADKLQNKADRYYFYDSINIGSDSIYISRLDLNVEGSTVEQPIKPMIRLCIPYRDQSGTLRGIVCMNYLAGNMLSSTSKIAESTEGSMNLLNDDGYWLYNQDDPAREWGFMYNDRSDDTFANTFPEEWSVIGDDSSKEGHMLTGNGLFTYADVLADTGYTSENREFHYVLDEGDWTIVSHISPQGDYTDLLAVGSFRYLISVIEGNILVLLLLLVGAFAFSYLLERNHSRKQRVKYFSEFDEMTGALNRREGLARMAKMAQRRRSVDSAGCLCFIDINDLKTVNDTFGHDAGDELILTVLTVFKNCTRDVDSIIRMGGDEFIIAFDDLDAQDAEKVWERVIAQFESTNASGRYRYPISASHGIAEFTANETLDDIIERADTRMYDEKRAMKDARAVKR